VLIAVAQEDRSGQTTDLPSPDFTAKNLAEAAEIILRQERG
jgi:hypothetical protein